jgi:integrase
MAVRKIRASWWVDFRVNTVRYRKRSPDNSKAGAKAYESLLLPKLTGGKPINRGSQQQLTFEEFAWKWFDDYVKPNNKYSEQMAKRYVLTASLVPFFGRTPIGRIRAHDIERYKAAQVQQGFKSKTISNRLTVLNKCLVTAYEWLELEGAPPKIKWPKWSPPEIDYLSPDECELLLSHANGVIFEMVLMALRTGMRQGELRGLQWSSLDWLTRSVAVRHSRDDRGVLVPPKNGRGRHIPLDIDVYTLLHQRKEETGYVFLRRDGQPFNNDRLNNAIRRLGRQAGLRKIGWHTLRHTFASHLAMRGVPLPAEGALRPCLHHDDHEVRARRSVHATNGNRDAEPEDDGG